VIYRPGQKVPEPGEYQEITGHGVEIEGDTAILDRGRFPPTNIKGNRWITKTSEGEAMGIMDFRLTMRDRETRAAEIALDGRSTSTIDTASQMQKEISGLFIEFSELISNGKPTGMTYAAELIPAFQIEDLVFGFARSAGGWLLVGQLESNQSSVLLGADGEGNDRAVAELLQVLMPLVE
jgi:hypothetical protein